MVRPLIVALSLATAACAGSTDDGLEESHGETQDEVRVSDVRQFQIRRSSACGGLDHWTVDMVRRTLRGSACVDSTMLTVDRRLSGSELEFLRMGLFEIRTTKRPQTCPTQAAAARLDIVRETRIDRYVDVIGACDSATPVTTRSLGDLFNVLEEIATTKES